MDISNIQIKKYENNYNLRNNYLKNNTPIKKLEHNYDLRMNNTKPINLDNNTPNKKCENNNDFRNNYLKKYDDDNIQKNNNQNNHSPISLQQKNNLNYDYDLKKKKESKPYNIDYFNNKIKKLQNQLDEEKKKNIRLEKELNIAKQKIKESEDIEDKIIAINFISVDQRINYPMKCKSSDIFLKLEEKLYHEYPDIKNKNVFFMAQGILINKNDSLDKNKIKNGDSILVNIN